MHRRLAVVGAALCALALAQPAGAATPIQIGSGAFPDIAVDDAGTAHVAWTGLPSDSPNGEPPVRYCKFNRNALECETTVSLPTPSSSAGARTRVFTPSPGRVIIVAYRCCGTEEGTYAWESTDSGATFSDPKLIGKLQLDDAEYADNAIYAESNSGTRVQRMPLAGPVPTTFAELNAGFGIPIYGGIGLRGTTPITVSADGTDATLHIQNGVGDPNDSTSWGGPAPFGPGPSDVNIASSSAGIVMLYRVPATPSPELFARKLNGDTWGPAVPIAPTEEPIFNDLSADSSGRFTALWVENSVTPNEVRFSQSKDGTVWTAPVTVARESAVDDLFSTQVSTAPDGLGFGVWDSNGTTGAIKITPLDKEEGSGGGGTDDPNDAGAPSTVATTTVGGVEIGLIAPTKCVTPPDKITLRVTSKVKKKLSPTKRVRITIATFKLDKKTVKDKKSAFKGKFATKGFKAGSKHKLSAKVNLKPIKGKGKAKNKTLKGTLTICG